MKTSLVAGSLAAAATFGSACVVSLDSQAQIVREERRFTVSGVPDLHLTTFDGSIEIQAWDKPDILIDIEKRGATKEAVDALEIKSSQNGNRIELEVKRPRTESFSGFGFHQSASARLIVSVPREVNVNARSGDGSIRIERVNGRFELRTGDGSIRAAEVGGELILDTGDGSITVEGSRGRIRLETGDGGVNVTGRFTSVKLHTGDGSIRSDLDVLDQLERDRDREENRRTLRGRLGSGGKQLRIRTGDGTIRLRPS